MEKFQAFLDQLEHEQNIALNDIPEIDLYMDQVLNYIESCLKDYIKSDEKIIITCTLCTAICSAFKIKI